MNGPAAAVTQTANAAPVSTFSQTELPIFAVAVGI